MENVAVSPFDGSQWGSLRYSITKANRIRERIQSTLQMFAMVFKDHSSAGLEFLDVEDQHSLGMVRSMFGEATFRIGWTFSPPLAQRTEEELVGRVVALVRDPFDLSLDPKTLPPIWELRVPEHGEITAVVGEHLYNISTRGMSYEVGDHIFVAGMALNRAIAEAAT